MHDWVNTYKPAASVRLHLLLAAAMWTVVGSLLLFFGGRWLLTARGPYVWALLVVAIVIGLLKAQFVLGRAAQRMIQRIRTRGDGRRLGGFTSWRTWALVAVMATAGRLLRGGLLPRPVVGFIYVAVGTALLFATRLLWQAWRWRPSEG